MTAEPNVSELLEGLFSDYRAEWPQAQFATLFIMPSYFRKLETARPCFLIGGRGTGKTTTLRSLRFDLVQQRLGCPKQDTPYFGIYVRVNKNRVRAFAGPDLHADDWARAFAHYFNLLALIEFCRLAEWLPEGSTLDYGPAAESLSLPPPASPTDLRKTLESLVRRLELFINNPKEQERPTLSAPEAPLREMATVLSSSATIRGRPLYCCIDEYENLGDNQQAVLNTYIKHAEPPLSYKIGVRRYGHRNKCTIDTDDLLSTPDDFDQIDIAKEEDFSRFAKQVMNARLVHGRTLGLDVPEDIHSFLEDLSLGDEARLLGAEAIADDVIGQLVSGEQEALAWAQRQPKTKLFLARYVAEQRSCSVADVVSEWTADEGKFAHVVNNHLYSSLFWLSRGHKGARTKKYYCGADTLIALAGGTIRFFLELVYESIRQVRPEADGPIRIDAKSQTMAAKYVGLRKLDQLEGLSDHGPQLKRLALAIGKVFFEFARAPLGRAPEANMFVLSGDGEVRAKAESLLREGVSHLAFEVSPLTKATSAGESREDEYRLHPIFTAFFEYSHRKKRHVTFDAAALLRVTSAPREAILELMKGVTQSPMGELPDQLALFERFFDG